MYGWLAVVAVGGLGLFGLINLWLIPSATDPYLWRGAMMGLCAFYGALTLVRRIPSHLLGSIANLLFYTITAYSIALVWANEDKTPIQLGAIITVTLAIMVQRDGRLLLIYAGLLCGTIGLLTWLEILRPDFALTLAILAVMGTGISYSRLSTLVRLRKSLRAQREAESKLKELVFRDPLTGVYNRIHLMDALQRELKRAARNNKSLAILYIDLDEFKAINDTFGHLVGDRFIKAIAERIHSVCRGSDLVARMGGDEFLVLLSDLENAQDAARVSERLIEILDNPVSAEQVSLPFAQALA